MDQSGLVKERACSLWALRQHNIVIDLDGHERLGRLRVRRRKGKADHEAIPSSRADGSKVGFPRSLGPLSGAVRKDG